MKRFGFIAMLCALALSGCATTRNISVDNTLSVAKVTSAALAPSEGNSREMDEFITKSLSARGITVGEPLPPSTTTTDKAELIVSYVDAWHWDLVMYLRYLNVYFYDGKTGRLVMSGNWKNSLLHGYPNAEKVVREVIDDMIARLPDSNPNTVSSK